MISNYLAAVNSPMVLIEECVGLSVEELVDKGFSVIARPPSLPAWPILTSAAPPLVLNSAPPAALRCRSTR